MSVQEHVRIAAEGKDTIRKWRYSNPGEQLDLSHHIFSDYLNFCDTDLSGADLSGARFDQSNFNLADLRDANLKDTSFGKSFMRFADLQGANVDNADFSGADIMGVDLRRAVNVSTADFGLPVLDLKGIWLFITGLWKARQQKFRAERRAMI